QYQHAQPVRHRSTQLRQTLPRAPRRRCFERLVVRRSLLLAERLGRDGPEQEVFGYDEGEVRCGVRTAMTITETDDDIFAERNFAGLHKRLGGVPLYRIGLDPPPGMATEADVLRHLDAGDKRLYELIEGTLVE